MPFKHLLVAHDGSPGAERAWQVALQMAADQGADVCIISVEEHLPHYAATVGEVDEEVAQANDYYARLGERAAGEAAAAGVPFRQVIVRGHAARAIVQYTEQDMFDLLVIGRAGHGDTWGRFMGSTVDRVTRHASCSVLVVH